MILRLADYISEGFVFAFMSLLQLSVTIKNKPKASYKIFLVTTFIFCSGTFIHFNALVTSFMTVQTNAVGIQSYKDIVDNGYKFILKKNSDTVVDFKKSPDGSGRHEIYKKLLEGNKDAYAETFPDIVGKYQLGASWTITTASTHPEQII